MGQILIQENAIVLAAAERMSALGAQAAEKILNGRQAIVEDDQTQRIVILLTAYRRRDDLTEKQLEAILYDLKELSEESSFPTTDPIVGQELIYVIE